MPKFFQKRRARIGGRAGIPIDMLAESGLVEHRLIVRFHRAELFRADIEGIVDRLVWQGQTEPDRGAKVFDIEELIAVVARAKHREVAAVQRPIVKSEKTPSRSGPMNDFGRMIGTTSPLARSSARSSRPESSPGHTARRRRAGRPPATGDDRECRRPRSRRCGPPA